MFLAVKELWHHKLRFSMIGAIIVLIAWLVFILSGLGNGLATLSAASFKNMKADYVVFEKDARNSMSRSILSENLISELLKDGNVDQASPMGAASATVTNDNTSVEVKKLDVTILGIEPGSFLEPQIIEGQALQIEQPEQVIVNDAFKDEGYNIGDTIAIEGSEEKVEIIGFVTNETYNHLPVIFTTLDKWRAIQYAAPGSDKGIESPVNGIMLQGKGVDAEALSKNIDSIDVATKSAAIFGMPGYKEEMGTIYMMLAFLLIISACILAVFFYVLTIQKSNQIGILKAIGASQSFLARSIVSQVFLLSLVSIIVGIGLTYLTALVFPKGMPFDLQTSLVIIYGIALLLISTLSAWISVRKVAKIDPLMALGRVE